MRFGSNTIGRRLAAIRKNRDLTQAELAIAIGKSMQLISRWEQGTATISPADITKLAHALRCSRAALLASPDAN